MKHTLRHFALIAISAMALSALTVHAADEDLHGLSQQAITSFQAMDSSLKPLMDSAAGYAVFPDVGKGGFIVGGAHGKGLLYEKGVAMGQTSMTQASIGAQAGGARGLCRHLSKTQQSQMYGCCVLSLRSRTACRHPKPPDPDHRAPCRCASHWPQSCSPVVAKSNKRHLLLAAPARDVVPVF